MPSKARTFVNKWSRKLHRWGAIITLLPLFLVISTGLLLQLKKQLPWVQPPEQRAPNPGMEISFDDILAAASTVPQAGIASWDDINRLDIRPSRGVVKVRAESRWEIQIDTRTGEVLQAAYRRSDLIESLHDGSFFGDWAKLTIFLANGLILLALWVTGAYLWILPTLARRKRARNA